MTRSKLLLGVVAVALAGTGYLKAAPAQAPNPSVSRPAARAQVASSTPASASAGHVQSLVTQYCVTCHNEKLKTAGLLLDKVNFEQVGANAEVLEKVLQKVKAGMMPPLGRPRPDKAAHEGFVSWLETALDRAAAANPNPGRPVVHRLNRVEYTNAIRDLLALEIDSRALLPTDESGYNFDNIGDVLSFSPGLLERYMLAAQKVSRLAIGDVALAPMVDTYPVNPYIDQAVRVSDELPFGSRGGAVIRHYFPRDGEYEVRLRLFRNFSAGITQGMNVRERLDVRLDGVRLQLFNVGGECNGSKEERCQKTLGGRVSLRSSEYERTADENLRVRFSAKAGSHAVGISFVQQAPETAIEGGAAKRRMGLEGRQMSISEVVITRLATTDQAPDTPSRGRVFVCRPATTADEESCAEKILTTLARRAYRRPITAADNQILLKLYRTGRTEGGFEAGIQHALEGMLVSPDFLFRVENDPAQAKPASVYTVSDVELASRLSFFLWSSIPDDELLDVAARGALTKPGMLERQVRRMLNDERATATLVSNFLSQWLMLRDLRAVSPDQTTYPDFDESLRQAFQRETELFLASQVREDRPVMDLLTANYTFVNERLARFYGMPNIYGTHFRRVAVTDPNRLGLLGHASLLTVTSYPNRTSPVVRGFYVLSRLLNAPPPPPPPNVPALEEAVKGKASLTVRARLEQHRKNPVCAGCHARMDPIGFALENFNGIGKWRAAEFGTPIDAAGVLYDGTKMNGPAALRQALVGHREEFVLTLTQNLMTYALGRGTEYYDLPAVRRIVKGAASSEYRWSSLIVELVNSLPFRQRWVPESAPASGESVAVR